MTADKHKSTPLFVACLVAYLATGAIARYTDLLSGPMSWYHYLMLVPLALVGLLMQIYPAIYIKAKLKEWGMFEDKADEVAVVFWLACLLLWYLFFFPDR